MTKKLVIILSVFFCSTILYADMKDALVSCLKASVEDYGFNGKELNSFYCMSLESRTMYENLSRFEPFNQVDVETYVNESSGARTLYEHLSQAHYPVRVDYDGYQVIGTFKGFAIKCESNFMKTSSKCSVRYSNKQLKSIFERYILE